MKLRTFRQSGDPVELSAREAYQADWTKYYDKAAERAKLDMIKLQRFLSYGERQLVKKHNAEVLTEIPKTAKAWNTLITKYEDTPIALAKTADGKELVLLIMDRLGG